MSTALSATQHLSSPPQQEPNPDWKRQLIECLDAYRAKHIETSAPPPPPSEITADSKASRIARRVAQRYAVVPTYSELLAATEAKQAAEKLLADQVERDAQAAQEQMRQEQIEFADAETTISDSLQSFPSGRSDELDSAESVSSRATQAATPVMPQFATRSQEMHLHQNVPEPEPTLEDLWASVLVEPRSVLPSKLIEFPRELVSSHRARPRAMQGEIAESDMTSQPEPTQLRIFEVSPELADSPATAASVIERTAATALKAEDRPTSEPVIRSSTEIASTESVRSNESLVKQGPAARPVTQGTDRSGAASVSRDFVSPLKSPSSSSASSARAYKNLEWAAISLDKDPVVARRKVETSVADFVPFLVEPASIDRRVMAFAVDFAAVTAGFLAFLLVFSASTPHLPTGLTAIALGVVVYVSLWILYQMLFFSLSGSTAGMLYAHIALCTFDDQNPTRSALRRRLAAWWLSCLPLGMGFLWCFVDEDNLSWHDRITRMYQREY